MGADFIYAICEWPMSKDEKPAVPCERLSEIVLDRLEGALSANVDWEDYGIMRDDDNTDEEERERLYNWSKDFIVTLFTQGAIWRDTAGLNLHDRNYVITGDMSWGDVTESYDYINFIDATGITREPVEL